MLTNEAYTQFCDFWTAYRPADKYANRRSCTFSQWMQRSPPARRAMLHTYRNALYNRGWLYLTEVLELSDYAGYNLMTGERLQDTSPIASG